MKLINFPRGRGSLLRATLIATGIAICPTAQVSAADNEPAISSGYLCCNMRVYDDWISDINYRFDGTAIIPPGTRAWVKGVGRYSFTLAMAGKTRSLGNDYSRSLSDDEFLRRYLLTTSPRQKIRTWHPDIQEAVGRMKVMIGMTEEQALTALGYPPHNYTPDLSVPVWQYWLDRSSQFDLHWDKNRRLKQVKSDPITRRKVTWRPKTKPPVKPAPLKKPQAGASQAPLVAPVQPAPTELPKPVEIHTWQAPAPEAPGSHQSLRNSLSFANTSR